MNKLSKTFKPYSDMTNRMQKISPELQNSAEIMSKLQINPKILKLIQQTNNAIQNYEKADPHIEKLFLEMENNVNLSEALEILPYRQIFKLALNNFQIKDLTVLKLINEDYFQKNFLNYFDEIEIDQKFKNRKNIAKEALELYKLGYFAGCSCLLHSTLEGIMTDYLLFKKIIIKSNKHGKTQYKSVDKKEIIIGLSKKIKLAKDINENFLRLETYKFDSNKNKKLSDERNDVLHGSNIDNFTDERCFISFIWITSILNSIKTEQIKNSLSIK